MKKCPNCGSEVAEAAKFCTNCGNELATGDEVKPKAVASEVQSENASEQVKESAAKQEAGVSLDKEKLKASSLSYWSWLVTAWKHPFKVKNETSKWSGLITLGLEGLIFGLSIMIIFRGYYNSANSYYSQAFGGSFGDNPVGLGTLITFFLATFLSALATTGIGYGARELFTPNRTDFLDFVNGIAHRTSPILLLNLIALLFSFTVGFTTSGVLNTMLVLCLFSITLAIWQFGILAPIYELENPKLDRLYILIIVTLLNGFVYGLAYMAVAAHYVSYLQQLF